MKKISFLLRNVFLVLALIILSNTALKAQSANTNQLGLRLGGFSGVTFTHVGGNNVGFELNLLADGPSSGWWLFSADIEKHIPIGKGFVIYLGGGGFLANHNHYFRRDNFHETRTQLGLEGVVGLVYYIPNAPVNLGLDLRPRFGWWYDYVTPWDAGLSVRYVFGKHL